VAEPLLPLVCRPVGEVDDTRGERMRVHELQGFPIFLILEEALLTTQYYRVNNEPELVEEPVPEQRPDEFPRFRVP
jgi:hypothetical protein